MTRFRFRLQKVLEQRGRAEQEAKDAYLEARARRLGAERELADLRSRRDRAIADADPGLDARLTLDLFVMRLDGQEAEQVQAIEAMETREEAAREDWIERRKEHQAILKLRDHAFERWQLEATREEQAALDEWAVLRSAA